MIDFNRKLARNIDVSVLIIALILTVIGLTVIASVTYERFGLSYIKTQVVATVLGLLVIMGIMAIDYRWFKEYSGVIYIGTLVMLFATLIYGRTISGSKSWILFGPARIQPSELAKLAMILVLAAYIAEREEEMKYISGMLKACVVIGIPILLILAQNDLGTALVFVAILIGMLFVGGGNARLMGIVILVGVMLVMGLVYFSMYHEFDFPFLKSYQLLRLQVLLDPYIDPQGAGYNIIQSEISIGSGKLVGKGLFQGTQNKLQFLPVRHTDFIFPVIGEELGFIGSTVVLLIYLALVLRCVFIARSARDSYGTLIVVGIASMWMFHILENAGMTMGVMPITGIPLPFISYGGSSMVTNLVAVGIVMNIRMRKQKILF